MPSITENNKEFIQYFPNNCYPISDLDELKHHSQKYDYRTSKLPIHLYRELKIIDTQLREIESSISQGFFQKAVIVSDHGASRLAVIREKEAKAALKQEEKGEHSGRCCPVDHDPEIPFAAYENGYSILANYDRFPGGRAANVEVHGGASLEEVLVPVLVITKKQATMTARFQPAVINCKYGEVVSVELECSAALSLPRLLVTISGKEYAYEGNFIGDQRHIRFSVPQIRRSNTFSAALFDGEARVAADLTFTVNMQRKTKELDLFQKGGL